MGIEIIVSTFENKLERLDSSLLKYSKLTVINQKPKKFDNSIIENKKKNILWIDFDQIGLSRSRNLAIKYATEEYIYLADDDIVLNENFDITISEAINKDPDVDIFAFQVKGIEEEYKIYSKKEKDINFLSSMKLSSVQLVLKKDFVIRNKIYYDELFGTGSVYAMGEENIFLFDALKKKAKIKYIPSEIAKVHIGESSWFSGFDRDYFFNRGAIFYRMFGIASDFVSFIFCLRKYSLYKDNFNLLVALKLMREGKQNIKTHLNNEVNS